MSAAVDHRFEVSLAWLSAASAGVLSGENKPELTVGAPPEFGGKPAWWSPEHMLLGAAATCFMATFSVVAEKSKLRFEEARCRAFGTVGKTDRGLAFTSIELRVTLRVAGADAEKAARLLETAKRHCIVSNSLGAPVSLATEIGVFEEARTR
jgi:peroxiredoxin-like protein